MVVTVFWVPSWSVLVISVSILFLAVTFLLCCICLQKKKSNTLKFGVQCPNTSHIKNFNMSSNSLNKLMIFRHFGSSTDEFADGFTSANLPIYESKRQASESDLLESVDISERFNSSQLKVEELDEDLRSCGSADSKFTFFSTYPAMTTSDSNSDTGTFKSTGIVY